MSSFNLPWFRLFILDTVSVTAAVYNAALLIFWKYSRTHVIRTLSRPFIESLVFDLF